MVIDADCHISPTQEGSNSITCDKLITTMDDAGVDKALVWLHPPYKREISLANRYIYESSRSFPDRILGFGWADPNLGISDAKEEVRKCVFEYGFPGVKLNGSQNEYCIDDSHLALPVIEEIAKAGKILAFHVGGDAYERTHPFRVAKIAAMYPELPILVVHMGGEAYADISDAVIHFAEEHANMLLIGSSVRTLPILKAIRSLGAKRVCFGSDTPFELMHVELARYRALLENEVGEEGRRLVMGGNIERLLDL